MTFKPTRTSPLKTRLQSVQAALKQVRDRLEGLVEELGQAKSTQLAADRLRCVLQDRVEPALEDLESIRQHSLSGAPQ